MRDPLKDLSKEALADTRTLGLTLWFLAFKRGLIKDASVSEISIKFTWKKSPICRDLRVVVAHLKNPLLDREEYVRVITSMMCITAALEWLDTAHTVQVELIEAFSCFNRHLSLGQMHLDENIVDLQLLNASDESDTQLIKWAESYY